MESEERAVWREGWRVKRGLCGGGGGVECEEREGWREGGRLKRGLCGGRGAE